MSSADLETLVAEALSAARAARDALGAIDALPSDLDPLAEEVDARLSCAALFEEDALARLAALARGLGTLRDAERRWVQPENAIWPEALLTERGEMLAAACHALARVRGAAAAVVDRRAAAGLVAAALAPRG